MSVTNFTTVSASQAHSVSNYHRILHFSGQNLRFSRAPEPSAIILPETKHQLSSSVICCRRAGLEIRVRCGGHSYEGLSSTSDHGASFVIIDMMNLNRVIMELESETAWPGRARTVGVGGHISGGGFGFFSRKYGLAADNVLDAVLVDAEGRLLDRESMGEEVFWAIRGGGGGLWGVVFAWKIKLLKFPPVITAFIVSRHGAKRRLAQLLHKWQHVAPYLDDEFYLSVSVSAGFPDGKGDRNGVSATFKGLFLGGENEAVSLLTGAFPELETREEDCTEMSWIESVLFFSDLGYGSSIDDLKIRRPKENLYFKAKSDYVQTPIPVEGFSKIFDILEAEPKGFAIFDPYGGAMARIHDDAIAFPHRKGNLFNIQYMVSWKEGENANSEIYGDWIREFYSSMTPYVSSGPRAAYVNYLDFDLGTVELISNGGSSRDAVERARVWGEKYFLRNYDRLVRAKTIADPNNVFRHQQGIPPLPSNVEALTEYDWSLDKSCRHSVIWPSQLKLEKN
ncbi:hypothetical protein Nepgr_028734 [Nepenthes gracilis]|uniref:FAD-binding PCMH-type domain-containing protein n=1 Tax=Nepenthes gracilis TaxID=150966 RepID=A0AAD3TD31_NEPGR|nr:hypothetical protein Nepgr_028734 [Nepenthes gracilis]